MSFFFWLNKKWELAKLCLPPGTTLRLRSVGQTLWMTTNEGLLATGFEFRWVKQSFQTLPIEPSPVGNINELYTWEKQKRND